MKKPIAVCLLGPACVLLWFGLSTAIPEFPGYASVVSGAVFVLGTYGIIRKM